MIADFAEIAFNPVCLFQMAKSKQENCLNLKNPQVVKCNFMVIYDLILNSEYKQHI